LWQVRSHKEQGLIPIATPTLLDRVDVYGDLNNFSPINRPLRAIKGTEERDESHVYLAQHYGKSAVAMNKVIHRVYLTWKHPRRWIELIFPMT
jgi:hypothetical protein